MWLCDKSSTTTWRGEANSGTYKGCFPASPFLTTMSTTDSSSRVNASSPKAISPVKSAGQPEHRTSVSQLNALMFCAAYSVCVSTVGTLGMLKVFELNMAWLVPSSIVSKMTSSSTTLSGGGSWASMIDGTKTVSSVYW